MKTINLKNKKIYSKTLFILINLCYNCHYLQKLHIIQDNILLIIDLYIN